MATAETQSRRIDRFNASAPSGLACVIGLMQRSAAGATLQTDRGGVVLVNMEQKCKKRRVLQHELAHNGRGLIGLRKPETRPRGACPSSSLRAPLLYALIYLADNAAGEP